MISRCSTSGQYVYPDATWWVRGFPAQSRTLRAPTNQKKLLFRRIISSAAISATNIIPTATALKSEEKKDFRDVLLRAKQHAHGCKNPTLRVSRLREVGHRENLPVVGPVEDRHGGFQLYQRPCTSGNPASVRGAPKLPQPPASYLAIAHPGGVQSVECERDITGHLARMVARCVPGMAGTHFLKGLP